MNKYLVNCCTHIEPMVQLNTNARGVDFIYMNTAILYIDSNNLRRNSTIFQKRSCNTYPASVFEFLNPGFGWSILALVWCGIPAQFSFHFIWTYLDLRFGWSIFI